MAKEKSPSITGGLGFQGYNTKDYKYGTTIRTGNTASPAGRDRVYGGAPTPKTPAAKPGMISLPGTAMKMLGQKFSTKYTPGSYATYRKGLAAKKPAAVVKPAAKKLATVVSNVTNEKLSPAPAKAKAPATKAVSMRTGDTTGVTTGKTTGTVSRTPGMATKTKQSAYGRQMANAARNQPAGPTGGGGRGGGMGGGTGPSRSGGGGNLGGARGRISEPGGSKR
jgi:hypothetical protein